VYAGETVNKKKSPVYLIEDSSVKSSPGIQTHIQRERERERENI